MILRPLYRTGDLILFVSQRQASQRAKRITPNAFGTLTEEPLHVERLDRFDLPLKREPKAVEVDLPKGLSAKYLKKLENAQNRVDRGKVLIECKNKEFNWFESDMVPRRGEMPLCSRYWEKNKYKDDWFTVHRVCKKVPSTSCEQFSWDHFTPDIITTQMRDRLLEIGLYKPLGIQAESFRYFNSKNHLFIAAETGSGKTVAYGAPIVGRILNRRRRGIRERAVILLATTPLKVQTFEFLNKFVTNLDVNVKMAGMEGNTNWDILVGTPGLVEHELQQSNSDGITQMVLDEADMLLDEGFTQVLTELFSLVPIANSETNLGNREDGARIIFCSASCPLELEYLAEGVVDKQTLSYIKSAQLHKLLNNVEMKFIRIRERDKMDQLLPLLEADLKRGDKNQTMVFCKDKQTAVFVFHQVLRNKYPVIYWDNQITSEYLDKCRVIVATDAASRGIDLPRLSHIINYDMARHSVDFLHRIGRVGRLSSHFSARVTSFVRTKHQVMLTNQIEKAARLGKPLRNIETDVTGQLRETNDDEDED